MMAALVQAGKPPRGEDYIDEISQSEDTVRCFSFHEAVDRGLSLPGLHGLNLPPVTSFELQSNSVINNWPAELLAIYDQEGLMPNSPVLRRLRTSTLPFVSRDTASTNRDDGRAQLVTALFERFRMTRCHLFADP